MNYKQMVQDIDYIVNNDWAAEMEAKQLPHSKRYTQSEAQDMAAAIAKVYKISHGFSCSACGGKYLVLPVEKRNQTH